MTAEEQTSHDHLWRVICGEARMAIAVDPVLVGPLTAAIFDLERAGKRDRR